MSTSYHWNCAPERRKPLPWTDQLLLSVCEDDEWALDRGCQKVLAPSLWPCWQGEGPLPHLPAPFRLLNLVQVPSIGRTWFAGESENEDFQICSIGKHRTKEIGIDAGDQFTISAIEGRTGVGVASGGWFPFPSGPGRWASGTLLGELGMCPLHFAV